MKQTAEFEDGYEDIEGVPVSAVFAEDRTNRYGTVPGLDDEELADVAELERQIVVQEWGPVLALPVKTRRGGIKPNIDDSGHVDFGAFGTVDFDRIRPAFDAARYKEDKLWEQLENTLIMLSIVRERVPLKARRQVIKCLWDGIIDLEHIANQDMQVLARLYLRARRIQQEIAQLKEARAKARRAKARAFLEG